MAFRVDNCKADDKFTNSAHELHCLGCQKTKYGRDIVTISIGHWFVCSSSAWWFKKDVNAPLAAINISSRAFYSETANLLRCQIISLLFSKKRKKSNENSVWRSSIFPIMKPWCIFWGWIVLFLWHFPMRCCQFARSIFSPLSQIGFFRNRASAFWRPIEFEIRTKAKRMPRIATLRERTIATLPICR